MTMPRRPASVLLVLIPVFLATASAVPASAASTAYTAIAVGQYQSCALTSAGGVECWGGYGSGQALGSTLPVGVPGLESGVVAITAAGLHSCALTASGGVKCWGGNTHGELGTGNLVSSTTPVDVVGLSSGVAAISAGSFSTCALMNTGGMKCWGYNAAGQLGDGTTTYRTTPVDVLGLGGTVKQIAAGTTHTCGLMTTGGVKCWGENIQAQLGNGNRIDSLVPVGVVGLASGVASISAGGNHSCVVTTAHGAKCWGDNRFGELGDGTKMFRRFRVDVSGLTSGVASISAGTVYTCAVTTAAAASCWGRNEVVGLGGNGTTIDSSLPVGVFGLTSGITAVATNLTHTCALTTAGFAKCWGQNSSGELGNGTFANSLVPVDVNPQPSFRPDGLVGTGTGPLVGDDIFNATGIEQTTATEPVVRGNSITFTWQIQNDGSLPDLIVLSGQGKSPGFTVKFTSGTSDITGAVVAGTYSRSIAPGTSIAITLKMTVLATAPIGAARGNFMTATSQNGSTLDTVLAKVVAT